MVKTVKFFIFKGNEKHDGIEVKSHVISKTSSWENPILPWAYFRQRYKSSLGEQLKKPKAWP